MKKFSRFDAAVIIVVAGLSALAALLTWQSRRQGVRIASTHPAHHAEDVSTKQSIVVRFTEPMDRSGFGTSNASREPFPLLLQPSVTGAAHWDGSNLEFTPDSAFEADTLYTVTLADDLQSIQGRPLQGERQWQFQTRSPAVLYLAPDHDDIMQLTRLDPSDMRARRLSKTSSDILDYALSPDGSAIVYAQSNSSGGSDLRLLTLATDEQSTLLKCQGCSMF